VVARPRRRPRKIVRAKWSAPRVPPRVVSRARGWGNASSAAAIRAALILCADHELNVSSFTARCVASAGSNPYQVVIAGLAAIEGTRHGGASIRVEALLRTLRGTREIRAALIEHLRRGQSIDGFGHPLYPDADPRTIALMEMLHESHPRSSELSSAEEVARAAGSLLDQRPTIDFRAVRTARSHQAASALCRSHLTAISTRRLPATAGPGRRPRSLGRPEHEVVRVSTVLAATAALLLGAAFPGSALPGAALLRTALLAASGALA
jgi:hypothetical protein